MDSSAALQAAWTGKRTTGDLSGSGYLAALAVGLRASILRFSVTEFGQLAMACRHTADSKNLRDAGVSTARMPMCGPNRCGVPSRPATRMPRIRSRRHAGDWSSIQLSRRSVRSLSQQNCGTTLVRDELSGWLNGMDRYGHGSDRPFWLEAQNGGYYVSDRIKGRREIEVLSAGIFGGIQPEKLKDIPGLTADGLFQRFAPIGMASASDERDDPSTRMSRIVSTPWRPTSEGSRRSPSPSTTKRALST